MDNIDEPDALQIAQNSLMLAAVRALMESHPNPASFRESWANCLALTTKDLMLSAAENPVTLEQVNDAFRTLLPVWESYFPDLPAAKTKPPHR